MSASRTNSAGITQPRCPTCGGNQFSFIEVSGPANTVLQLKQQLDHLQARYEARGADLWNDFPEGDGKVVEAAHLEDVAFQALADQPKAPKAKEHTAKLETVQREFAQARAAILEKLQHAEQNVAMVYCTNCGFLVGAAPAPSREIESTRRLEKGLAEVRDAITQLSRNLSEAFALLRKELHSQQPR